MSVILIYTWPENYGDSKAAIHESFVEAWRTIKSGKTDYIFTKSTLSHLFNLIYTEKIFSNGVL